MWKKDYSTNKKCFDCNKPITNKAIRCKKCAYKGKLNYIFGKHHSNEAKAKMSKASIGKKKSEKHKQNMSKAFKNKKVSLKTRKKISNTLKGQSLEERGHKLNCSCSFCKAKRKELINKNNHNWHGGISKLPYSFDFNKNLKEQVRKRDNYICQNCNITQKEHLLIYKSKLSVHHIDYDKINSKENNLITLCHKCNIKANFNRKKWKSYFNSNK